MASGRVETIIWKFPVSVRVIIQWASEPEIDPPRSFRQGGTLATQRYAPLEAEAPWTISAGQVYKLGQECDKAVSASVANSGLITAGLGLGTLKRDPRDR
ncbi:hypothetical protein FRZ44_07160 [Hypericibacter terrae]|uniref:Uncharacterized protein n=1 Tax=Hypericibacter terrae TaxID=2602015 RepID=A0A5J6MDJ6_9PROT|nr:hypothetical protein FRZ44_07160 [Hypericibacter terrae]